MKKFVVIFLLSLGSSAFAQQQNPWIQNNINPPVQQFRGNFSNRANTDNNVGNQMDLQTNGLLENNQSPIQAQQSFAEINEVDNSPGNSNKSFSIDLSLNTKSFSSSSSSNSKTNRRTISKKVSKFKRNFYGKLMAHKKSRHQVDICFNWG